MRYAIALLVTGCSASAVPPALPPPTVAARHATTVTVYEYPYTPPGRCESAMFRADDQAPCTHPEHRQLVAYDDGGYWAVCICKGK